MKSSAQKWLLMVKMILIVSDGSAKWVISPSAIHISRKRMVFIHRTDWSFYILCATITLDNLVIIALFQVYRNSCSSYSFGLI